MSYERYYPNGWQSGQSGGTPMTPEALNHMEQGIAALDDELNAMKDYVIANGTSGVWSYWKFKSGLCIAMGTPTVSWSTQSTVISGQNRSTAAIDLTGIFTTVMGGTCSNVHRYVNCFVVPSGDTSAELWATSAANAANTLYSTTPKVVLFGTWA